MTPAGITREQWKLMGVLSLFWATVFGALGIFFPFYSLYLKENLGLSGQQVGLAMGVFHLVGLVGQPAWGYLADRTGARKTVLVVGHERHGLEEPILELLEFFGKKQIFY